jgi:hypothetical protein
MYWVIISLRSQQVDRGNEIINERKLNTPDNIIKTGPQLKKLLMNEEYKIYF